MSLLVSSVLPLSVFAASLSVTDNLVLRDIDDKAVEHGFLSKKQTIELTPGKHTIILKYKDVFEDIDFAEERLITSDYFVVKFSIDNQDKLVLSTSKIKDLAAAERFVQQPELTLRDEKQQSLVLTLEKLSDYELAKQVTKVVTTISAPTLVSQGSTTDNVSLKAEQDFNRKVMDKVDAVPMLKYWWKKATEAERSNFMTFIEQDNVSKPIQNLE